MAWCKDRLCLQNERVRCTAYLYYFFFFIYIHISFHIKGTYFCFIWQTYSTGITIKEPKNVEIQEQTVVIFVMFGLPSGLKNIYVAPKKIPTDSNLRTVVQLIWSLTSKDRLVSFKFSCPFLLEGLSARVNHLLYLQNKVIV